jgi:hypothetical protein
LDAALCGFTRVGAAGGFASSAGGALCAKAPAEYSKTTSASIFFFMSFPLCLETQLYKALEGFASAFLLPRSRPACSLGFLSASWQILSEISPTNA